MPYWCLQAGKWELNMFQVERFHKYSGKSPLWTSSPSQRMFWHVFSSPSQQSSS